MCGVYLVLSFICYKFFYHHPQHIGVQVNSARLGSAGFFLDMYPDNLALSATNNAKIRNRVTLYDVLRY